MSKPISRQQFVDRNEGAASKRLLVIAKDAYYVVPEG